MAELKRNFLEGKMNKDADERLVPDGQYRDALNIEISTSENNNKGVVQTLNGNVELSPLITSTATTLSVDAITVGSIVDQSNGLVYNLVSKAANLTGTPAVGIISDAIIELEPKSDYSTTDSTKLTFKPVLTDVYEARYQSSAFSTNIITGLPTTEAGVDSDGGVVNRTEGIKPGMRVQAITTGGDDLWAGADIRVKYQAQNGDVVLTSVSQLTSVYTAQNITDDVVLRFTKDRFLNFQQGTSELEANVGDGTSSSVTPNGNIVTGINLVEDFLLFTDGRNEPKKVNIVRSKLGTHSIRENSILFIKKENSYVKAGKKILIDESHVTVIRPNPNTPITVIATTDNSSNGTPNVVVTGNQNPQGPFGLFKLATAANVAFSVGTNFYVQLQADASYATNQILRITGATSATNATVVVTDYFPGADVYRLTIQYIDPTYDPSSTAAELWSVATIKTEAFYNETFVYFAYRYVYTDGERSCISPYSTAAFIPTTYSYSPEDGFNLGMQNVADEIVLKDFVPNYIPEDVVEVELLLKTTDNENIYLFRSAKIDSDTWDAPGTGSNRGSINITSEQAGSTLPSSQALRSFDAIPKKALAQEFSAGRLIYGNYYQDYNLEDGAGEYVKADINISAKSVATAFDSAFESNNNYRAIRSFDDNIPNNFNFRQRFRQIATTDSQAVHLPDSPGFIYATQRGLYAGVESLVNTNGAFNIDGTGTEADPYRYYYTAPVTGSYTYEINTRMYVFDADYANGGNAYEAPFRIAIYECDTNGEMLNIDNTGTPYETAPTPVFVGPVVSGGVESSVNNVIFNEISLTAEVELTATKHYQVFVLSNNEFVPSGLVVSPASQVGEIFNYTTTGIYDSQNGIQPFFNLLTVQALDIAITSSPSTTNTLPSLRGERSVKSGRPYQIGVVYRDKYGRESSVLVDEENNFEIPKAQAPNKNLLVANIINNAPSWADTYKFFIKETTSKYENLVLSTALSVTDGVYAWLAFNSSDRNKVKVGDFLVLKKEHGTSVPVVAEEASWKIIDIENEGAVGEDGEISAGTTSVIQSSVASNPELIGKFFVKVNYNTEFTTYLGTFAAIENVGFVNANGAVFETRTKQQLDLDLYYEVGTSYPVRLSEDYAEQFIPIGSTVQITKAWNSSGVDETFDSGTFINLANVKVVNDQLLGTTVTSVTGASSFPNIITNPYSNPESYCKIEWSNQAVLAGVPLNFLNQGFILEFTKPDGSSVTCEVVGGINAGYVYVKPYTHPTALFPTIDSNIKIPWYNCIAFGNGVESDTIKDDFNAPSIFNYVASGKQSGFKANLPLRDYKELHESNKLIYSQIFNEDAGVNRLNQFLAAENIVKKINPENGSVQKLFSRDTNLIIFCESKVFGGPVNKDIIFNADGNGQLITSNKVIGTLTPYSGDYGISTNPESFASDEFRIYFTDKDQGAVLRLSRDGITPIHEYGMEDWFNDNLKSAQALVGSFDDKKGEYNLTIHNVTNPGWKKEVYTLSFDEAAKGWVCFKSFIQEQGFSLNNQFFTFKNGDLYLHHYSEVNRNQFYGVDNDSSVTSIFNDAAGTVKSFNALSYEGTQAQIITDDGDGEYFNEFNNSTVSGVNLTERGWYAEYVNTDQQEGQVDVFIEKEGKWFNYIKGVATNYTNANDGVQTANNLDTHEFSVQGIGQLSNDATLVSGVAPTDAYALTFVNNTYAAFAGDWNTTGISLYGVTALSGATANTFVINPSPGFVLDATGFSNNTTDSLYSAVTFTNSGVANTPSNTVIATVTWVNQTISADDSIVFQIQNILPTDNTLTFESTFTQYYAIMGGASNQSQVSFTGGISTVSYLETGIWKLTANIPANETVELISYRISTSPGYVFKSNGIPSASIINPSGFQAFQAITTQVPNVNDQGYVDYVDVSVSVIASEDINLTDGYTISNNVGNSVAIGAFWNAGESFVIDDANTGTILGISTNGSIPTIVPEAAATWITSAVVDPNVLGQPYITATITTTVNTGAARTGTLKLYSSADVAQTSPQTLNFTQSVADYIALWQANLNNGNLIGVASQTNSADAAVVRLMVSTNGAAPLDADFTFNYTVGASGWLSFASAQVSPFQPNDGDTVNYWVDFNQLINPVGTTRTAIITAAHTSGSPSDTFTLNQAGSYDSSTDTIVFTDVSGTPITSLNIAQQAGLYTGYLIASGGTLPVVQIVPQAFGDQIDLWEIIEVTAVGGQPYTHTYKITVNDNDGAFLNLPGTISATVNAFYQDNTNGGSTASNTTTTPDDTLTVIQSAGPFGYFIAQNANPVPGVLPQEPTGVQNSSGSLFGQQSDGVLGWGAFFSSVGVNQYNNIDYTSTLFDLVGYWTDASGSLKYIEGTTSSPATTWVGSAVFSGASHPSWLSGVVTTAPSPAGNANGIIKFSIDDYVGANQYRYATIGLFTSASSTLPSHVFYIVQYNF